MESFKDHVETKIGDWTFSIESTTPSLPTPSSPITSNTTYFVYVENLEAAYNRALAHGAIPLAAPTDKHHRERSAEFQDEVGNKWRLYSYTQPAHMQHRQR